MGAEEGGVSESDFRTGLESVSNDWLFNYVCKNYPISEVPVLNNKEIFLKGAAIYLFIEDDKNNFINEYTKENMDKPTLYRIRSDFLDSLMWETEVLRRFGPKDIYERFLDLINSHFHTDWNEEVYDSFHTKYLDIEKEIRASMSGDEQSNEQFRNDIATPYAMASIYFI